MKVYAIQLEYSQWIKKFKPGYFGADFHCEEGSVCYEQRCVEERKKKELYYGPKIRKEKFKSLAAANYACAELFHNTVGITLDWLQYMHEGPGCYEYDQYDSGDESRAWVANQFCGFNLGKASYECSDTYENPGGFDYKDGCQWYFTAECKVVVSGLYSREYVRSVLGCMHRRGFGPDFQHMILSMLGIMNSENNLIDGAIEPY